MSDQDLVVETVRDILGGFEPFVLTPERRWDAGLWTALAEAGLTGVGLPEEAVVLDPGPDFTKTPHQTLELLRRIDEVRALGRPLLLALSRKDFLGAVTGRTPRGRDAATHAAIGFFAQTPGNIVRVHDVAAARDVVATVEVLTGVRDVPRDYLLPDALRHEPTP